MVKSSRFRGVTLFRPTGKWRAQISAGGKTTSLGDHDTEEEAARAFDRAAINKGGWNAKTNFDINDYRTEVDGLQRMTQGELVQMLRSKARKSGTQTSIYRGVSLLKQTGKWHAQINVGGKQVHLGFFATEDAAARAYDRAAINKGAREGGKIITNFDIADYSHELDVLRAITQEELVSALSSEGRRKATMEMLAEGADMSRAEQIFNRKLTIDPGAPTAKELKAKAERAVPKGMTHHLPMTAPTAASPHGAAGRHAAHAPSPGRLSGERGGRLPTDPSSAAGTPSNYHLPDTPDHGSGRAEYGGLNKLLSRGGEMQEAPQRGRQPGRTRGGKARPKLRRPGRKRGRNDSEETLTSEPSDKDSVFEFTDSEAPPVPSDSDKSWQGVTPKRKRGNDAVSRGRSRQHGARSRRQHQPQQESTPEPERAEEGYTPAPMSARDLLAAHLTPSGQAALRNMIFRREPHPPSPSQQAYGSHQAYGQQQQAYPQPQQSSHSQHTPPHRGTTPRSQGGFPSPLDRGAGLASPLEYHQSLGGMHHQQGGLSPLDNNDPLALPAFPGRPLALSRRLLDDDMGFPGASNPSSPLSSNRSTPPGARFGGHHHSGGPLSQRNSNLRSMHSMGRSDIAVLNRLLSNPTAALEHLAGAYGDPGTPYAQDQLQQLLRFDSIQALRDFNQLDKILQPLADDAAQQQHPQASDDPLDNGGLVDTGLYPPLAVSMLPPPADSPLRRTGARAPVGRSPRGPRMGRSPGASNAPMAGSNGAAPRACEGGNSLKRTHSEASSLDGGASSSQGMLRRRGSRKRAEVWRCPALFEGGAQHQDSDALLPLAPPLSRTQQPPNLSDPLLGSLLHEAALQLSAQPPGAGEPGSASRGSLLNGTQGSRRSLLNSLGTMLTQPGVGLEEVLRQQDSLLPLLRGAVDNGTPRQALYRAGPLPRPQDEEMAEAPGPGANSADDEAAAGLVTLAVPRALHTTLSHSANGNGGVQQRHAPARDGRTLEEEEAESPVLHNLRPWGSGLIKGPLGADGSERSPSVAGTNGHNNASGPMPRMQRLPSNPVLDEDSGTEDVEGAGSGEEGEGRTAKQARVGALRRSNSPQPSSPSRASGKNRRKIAPRRAAL